jgi:hypothetical protein
MRAEFRLHRARYEISMPSLLHPTRFLTWLCPFSARGHASAAAKIEARQMLNASSSRPYAAHGPQQRCFRVGRNRKGQWVAVDSSGACGGIFASREAALHYAAFETNRRPGAISIWSEPLELVI